MYATTRIWTWLQLRLTDARHDERGEIVEKVIIVAAAAAIAIGAMAAIAAAIDLKIAGLEL